MIMKVAWATYEYIIKTAAQIQQSVVKHDVKDIE